MSGFAQKREYIAEDGHLFSPGRRWFHCHPSTGPDTPSPRSHPITMAIEGETVYNDVFPFCAHFEINSSSEQTATLPHFPEAIRAYASAAFSRPKRCVMMSAG